MDKPSQDNQLKQMELEKKNNKNKIIIGILVVVVIILVALISATFVFNGNLFQQETPFVLQNVSFKDFADSEYIQLAGSIKPKKDFNYLEARVTFYDSNHNIVKTENTVWNEVNLKKDNVYSFDSKSVPLTADDKIVSAVVEFYELNGNTPLGSANVTINHTTTEDTSEASTASSSSDTSSQRQAYAYKADGTPMYSQSEVDSYMYNKYGYVDYHLQDNGYVNLDEPGYDDAGHYMY